MGRLKNPNCDNDKCTHADGLVKVLPLGGDGNLIVCYSCYLHEMRYRAARNRETKGADRDNWKIPKWQDLRVYEID